MKSKIHPVILCGGSGTRLWPLSRQSFPKQFAKVVGDESLFQSSVRRFSGTGFAAPIIVTGDPFRFIVTEQMAAIEKDPATILIEPEGRNTAPAVLAAALWLHRKDPSSLMLVAPSDHVVSDPVAFRQTVLNAEHRARSGDFVTIGITPTRPETGYGYLELAQGEDPNAETPQKLARFVEKPDEARAVQMVASGRYLWNAGLFLLPVEKTIEVYRSLHPQMVEAVEAALEGAMGDLGFTRLQATAWSNVDDVSIDYAIMEKSTNLAVMPYAKGWSDLGGWDAVWGESHPDDKGNVLSQHATAINCEQTLLRSESEGLEIVGIGLKNIIAVAMNDAVLIADMSQAQKVKEAVAALKAKNSKQATQLPVDHRPWGWFQSLVLGDRFQVKRIVVKPGGVLSLQSHHHRAEHWIVVAGTARVTIDGNVQLISENKSVFIPLGAIHRMENPGKVPMVLIEVQTGTYLGEDDIIRYEDLYART
jgi:mannose-1-phosphate guanylyltransferase / mannose-6-phosphate isomerase